MKPHLVAGILLLSAVGCLSAGGAGETGTETRLAVQEKLVEGAARILGRKELLIRGRRFVMDCSGVVLALPGFGFGPGGHRFPGQHPPQLGLSARLHRAFGKAALR